MYICMYGVLIHNSFPLYRESATTVVFQNSPTIFITLLFFYIIPILILPGYIIGLSNYLRDKSVLPTTGPYMASTWKKTITTPFRKAATFFNHHQQQPPSRDKNPPQPPGKESRVILDLQGEVMACAYEDVQVMWSILDKSKSSSTCNITSS